MWMSGSYTRPLREGRRVSMMFICIVERIYDINLRLVARVTDVGSNWLLTRVTAEARMNRLLGSMVSVELEN